MLAVESCPVHYFFKAARSHHLDFSLQTLA